MPLESLKLAEVALGAGLGFASAIFAEPLRRWIWGPAIRLETGDGPEYRSRTPLSVVMNVEDRQHVMQRGIEAEYLRVKVENYSKTNTVAQKCRAYLARVDRQQSNGTFEPTAFFESIPLAWSCRDDDPYAPLDLAVGVRQFIDLLSVSSNSRAFSLQVRPTPLRYAGLANDTGTFRFTVQVCGENFPPQEITVPFTWRGDWAEYVGRPAIPGK